MTEHNPLMERIISQQKKIANENQLRKKKKEKIQLAVLTSWILGISVLMGLVKALVNFLK